ncbi:SDR family oxidoreductase [Rhodococcus antarcticus]|jgi:3-oxoacyl-[acyl-carrier protein] reductase|uniref:SDR family oxidoreductase n=1 Tax=Rhodococcus antarcticus TaxID=2987751 RepID=A0ABY6P3K2_9NOCA|nr:SDR family NAD(P)-dependent oxidoreductase [Rhodococcus antarcticus]UZJ25841.1 SDR family oxidoreductase [Rhodococcus antarcticus]
MARFDGRVAIISGAAQGIGFGIAERLVSEGAAVALLDMNADAVASSAEALTLKGGKAIGITCDVSDEASVNAAVEKAVGELGKLDIVVNNAGITRDNMLFKMSVEEFDLVLAVHLRGTFLLTKAAQKHLVANKYGRVVNLSSRSALGNRGQANYSAAKAGIIGFTATAAIELGKFGITVNAVAPGFIDTAMTEATALRMGITPDQFREGAAQQIPVGRVGLPADIAATVAFFASEDAGFVSGQTLHVNGGQR